MGCLDAYIVRASSGQGKSTLLYRYAYEHYHPETTFVVKRLNDESMVSPIKQAIATRKRLGLPILVFIDNVGSGLQFWHRLAAEFAGQEIHFLVTIREEDWHRYSARVSGFVWEIVTPTLSLDEARDIFAQFQAKGKVAPSVTSGEWAFEQVADRPLLIEFTYLITHGQMLADRLKDQVQEMLRLGEDRAKLKVLRLISVAQTQGASVTIETILQNVDFGGDPDSALKSLEGEYLLFSNGECEGLHFVRSQHLIPLLHNIVPVEKTMVELIQILDQNNLISFTGNVFADSGINHAPLFESLVGRCQLESLTVINRIAMALFTASETAYYRLHQSLFDTAFDEIGTTGTFMLSIAALPFQTINTLEDLKGIFGADHPNLSLLSNLAQQFAPRKWDDRHDVKFLQAIIDNANPDRLLVDFSQIGVLLDWCRITRLDPSRLVQLIAAIDWRIQIYKADLDSAANFLIALHNHSRESYNHLLTSDKATLVSYFKLASDTLLIEERNGDLYIEFIVNEQASYTRPNEQAVERLRSLRKFFPAYQHYCSQGLYASMHGVRMPVDDTRKAMSSETLGLAADAFRNAAFLKVVETHYAAQSVYEWQEQWFAFRKGLLDLVTKCIELYKGVFGGKKLDFVSLNVVLNDSFLRALRLRRLPVSIAERFKQEQTVINEWGTDIQNFARQFVEHDPADSNQRSGQLMRYNLEEAVKLMPDAHRAFRHISSETQPYFELVEQEDQEKVVYANLVDILDFWFERPSTRVHDLRTVMEERRQDQRRRFVEAVRSTVAPLEEKGLMFVYPTGAFLDHPLVGLALGFEVVDFEKIIDQMVLIILQLASFPIECQFAYLVPLRKGFRYGSTIWRIGFDHIRDIAQGKLDGKDWALLPLEPPEKFFEILPDLRQASLVEFNMISEFYRILAALNAIRNTVFFVKSRLKAGQIFEVQLADKYQHRLLDELGQLSVQADALSVQMQRFAEGNPASREWLEFRRVCLERMTSFRKIEAIEPGTFQPLNILLDAELQSLLGRYLNARYLPSD